MPPVVINLRKADDSRDVVHRAVQTLAEGKLVVFPTETVYGLAASARRGDGVRRIFEAKGRAEDSPLTLAIRSVEDALDYAPHLGMKAQRLARRCWPGPVTLVVKHGDDEGLIRQLPPKSAPPWRPTARSACACRPTPRCSTCCTCSPGRSR